MEGMQAVLKVCAGLVEDSTLVHREDVHIKTQVTETRLYVLPLHCTCIATAALVHAMVSL